MILRVVFILATIFSCQGDNPFVRTPLGDIVGSHKLSYDGRKFSAFQGVPYAKPPVGQRRFEEPEPVAPWTETLNATSLVECVQTKFILRDFNVSGQEDCLYANIYVPRPQPIPNENLDVLVHIHGGAFLFDSGHSYPHPDFWMDREIVFVTFNYRLGIFGFLSTEDDVVPGNNGLKDQVLLLKWVRDNIASFGGNPNSVTIFGLSAGATSVHLHFLSPMSRGLFHRGISYSGVALSVCSLQQQPLTKAKLLANAVGCSTETTRSLIDCLKLKPFVELWNQMKIFYGYRATPFTPLNPCVEKGLNPFMNETSFQLLRKGAVYDAPWLVGVLADEGMAVIEHDTDKILKELEDDWVTHAPFLLAFNYSVDKSLWASTAEKIKHFYLGKDSITRRNAKRLGKMFGDRLMADEIDFSAKLQAGITKSPVYVLYLSYTGDYKDTIAHADDGHFYFRKRFGRDPTPNEAKMKDILVDIVVSFAKTSNPKVPGLIWEPTPPDELVYLNISSFTIDGIKLQKTKKSLTSRDFWVSIGFLPIRN